MNGGLGPCCKRGITKSTWAEGCYVIRWKLQRSRLGFRHIFGRQTIATCWKNPWNLCIALKAWQNARKLTSSFQRQLKGGKKWWENRRYSMQNVSLKLVSSWHSKATFISRCEISNRFEVETSVFGYILILGGLSKPCHVCFFCANLRGIHLYEVSRNKKFTWYLIHCFELPVFWQDPNLGIFCSTAFVGRFFTYPGLLTAWICVAHGTPVVVAVQACEVRQLNGRNTKIEWNAEMWCMYISVYIYIHIIM